MRYPDDQMLHLSAEEVENMEAVMAQWRERAILAERRYASCRENLILMAVFTGCLILGFVMAWTIWK